VHAIEQQYGLRISLFGAFETRRPAGFHIGVIRPVLEYAVAVWHTGLTTDLSEQLEAIQ